VWAALEDGHLPCSSGERQVLRVAASIAEGVPIDLGDVVTSLDAVNAVLVARAVLAAGGPPRGRLCFGGGGVPMTSVTITRPRHPLQGRLLRVLGRMRRHGRLELLLELPDGSKRLIPQAWTDAEPDTAPEAVATLGALADLLAACALVGELAVGRLAAQTERGQAARKSPSKEDFQATCPAQFDTRPASEATSSAGRPAAGDGDRRGDHATGRGDRQDRRPGGDGGGRR
jgi:hypothetical protein